MDLKTPLYDCHVACGGKIVPFAGYLLPVQYETGVIAEHMAVRTHAGLFDVSHMGEVMLTGPDAFANIQNLFTNDFTSMVDGKVRYSPMCYEDGGVVDDLIVYRYNDQKYLVVVNASNRHKDVAWMKEHLFGDVKLEDISDSVAQIALQGPAAAKILAKLTGDQELPTKFYTFKDPILVGGVSCIVSTTGYTGESGYECYCDPKDAPKLWNLLLEAGKEDGLIPCGLGCRDTLRLEAAMPLYGHEMDETITPMETDLGNYVKMSKPSFIGKEALSQKSEPTITRVGLKITGRGIAREHCDIYIGEQKIGHTTSGTHCPFIGQAVAMALVDIAHSAVGTVVEIDVRGRKLAAEIIPLPFYKKSK